MEIKMEKAEKELDMVIMKYPRDQIICCLLYTSDAADDVSWV